MNKNYFSYWFPKIENCGIQVPKSQVFKVPEELLEGFYAENPKAVETLKRWVTENVVSKLDGRYYFLKNAVFSNKFDFSNCITCAKTLFDDIAAINYQALCVGADGIDEIVIREVIKANLHKIPTIYSGLSLRNEFRVFYDFDTRKVLYTANYWDYDYVSPHLYNKSDVIIFDYAKEQLATVFAREKDYVEQLVSEAMGKVDLTGKWSIDVLYVEEDDGSIVVNEGSEDTLHSMYKALEDKKDKQNAFWLIDMAEAERSAYWNEKFCRGE